MIFRFRRCWSLYTEGICRLSIKFIPFLVIFLGTGAPAFSQDLPFVREQIQTLTSPRFWGRGYTKNGDYKAASYLAEQFRHFGLRAFGSNYFQVYEFEVTTFPGAMHMEVDGKKLVPGKDFIVNPASGSCHGTFAVHRIDSTLLTPSFKPQSLLQLDLKDKFVLFDTAGFGATVKGKEVRDLFRYKLFPKGLLYVADKPMIFSVRNIQLPECVLLARRTSLPAAPSRITVDVKSRIVNHQARNVIGYLPGETDSFLVFTAHYDHLGGMGRKTYFPGANDNASGTSMVLDFIRDFSAQGKHRYGYVFILFSGEEAGLNGSRYYAANPVFPLEKIKMVMNFDMVATGSEGITIFNGANYPKEFQKLDSLNKALGLNIVLKAKGTARNSDHYSFQEKKVKALFFNTIGKEVGYHVVEDRYEYLPFSVYEKLYKLVTAYIQTF